MAATCFFADPQNVAPDVAEIQRTEAKHLRTLGETREGRGEVVRRRRADVT